LEDLNRQAAAAAAAATAAIKVALAVVVSLFSHLAQRLWRGLKYT